MVLAIAPRATDSAETFRFFVAVGSNSFLWADQHPAEGSADFVQQAAPRRSAALNQVELNQDLLNQDLLNQDLLNQDLLNQDFAVRALALRMRPSRIPRTQAA
ncbi:MAG TPA: hypothetical protein VFE08_00670 [Candidatus Sulfotelmatobacter sp.]|nr:hypothetical protein [Candidatus Sulfotelmatobacter sp.]